MSEDLPDHDADGPDADEIARASADAMWAGDKASAGLGMQLLDVGPGYATMAMTITEAMTNGHGLAHGGFIFLLADSAFAFACNSRGEKTVAQHCQVSFLKPGRLGERLVATAHEVFQEGRSGIYDINVSVGEETIAEFRGHSRTVGGRWV
ncbi:hydroxyphenylacetyl-CoA thioesterase PaaI [Enterovirga rhinocerotis]|uniref:Acyl-CoA thioesterase n=1 Tax=Enterovirga rhinocerotis TaxID=1339210 RepID=A0A4R7BY96_9HYPH|nr:hydroxyphenylacetyl-CoA thioesterase PaaI [Enterovirga rhinocerotis]TDR89715.1 acyl-CoA thioesterase [Enterovirga rhinocerotis]